MHDGWLRAWHEKRPKGKTFFCTLKGGPLSTRYVQQVVKRMAHRAGLERVEKVSPHTLRHTYATELLDEGFSIREVQELLGHASVATTQVYTHVRPKGLADKIRARTEAADADEALRQRLRAIPAEQRKRLLDILESMTSQ